MGRDLREDDGGSAPPWRAPKPTETGLIRGALAVPSDGATAPAQSLRAMAGDCSSLYTKTTTTSAVRSRPDGPCARPPRAAPHDDGDDVCGATPTPQGGDGERSYALLRPASLCPDLPPPRRRETGPFSRVRTVLPDDGPRLRVRAPPSPRCSLRGWAWLRAGVALTGDFSVNANVAFFFFCTTAPPPPPPRSGGPQRLCRLRAEGGPFKCSCRFQSHAINARECRPTCWAVGWSTVCLLAEFGRVPRLFGRRACGPIEPLCRSRTDARAEPRVVGQKRGRGFSPLNRTFINLCPAAASCIVRSLYMDKIHADVYLACFMHARARLHGIPGEVEVEAGRERSWSCLMGRCRGRPLPRTHVCQIANGLHVDWARAKPGSTLYTGPCNLGCARHGTGES